jgi:preprotein translocase subunit YajC
VGVTSVVVPIVVAVLMGGPAWFGIQRLRKENSQQHSQASSERAEQQTVLMTALTQLQTTVLQTSTSLIDANHQIAELQARITSVLEDMSSGYSHLSDRLAVLESTLERT